MENLHCIVDTNDNSILYCVWQYSQYTCMFINFIGCGRRPFLHLCLQFGPSV